MRSLLLLVATGCAAAPVTAVKAPSAPAPIEAPAEAVSSEPQRVDCGNFRCFVFDTPERAAAQVFALRPRILAVGEAHALRGSTGASTARLFMDRLFPLMDPPASDLIVELMVPPAGCQKATTAVRAAQKVLTQAQVPSDRPTSGYDTKNQSEYAEMKVGATRAGINAELLRPTCSDLEAIRAAHDAEIPTMMETIARVTQKRVRELLSANRAQIVIYGGALHNDVAPLADRASWSFGPALVEAASGSYVELDVLGREAIEQAPLWKRFSWWSSLDREAHPDKATLIEVKPDSSYVIVLPRT